MFVMSGTDLQVGKGGGMGPPPASLHQQRQDKYKGEDGHDERLGSRWCSVRLAILFLFFMNVLNYIDRGIVPGANKEFLQ